MDAISLSPHHIYNHHRNDEEINVPQQEIALVNKLYSSGLPESLSGGFYIKTINWNRPDKDFLINNSTNAILLLFDHLSIDDVLDIKRLRARDKMIHLPMVVYASSLDEHYHLVLIKSGVDAIFTGSFNSSLINTQLNALISQRQILKAFYTNESEKAESNLTSYDQVFLKRARQVVLDNYTDASFNIEQFVALMRVSRTMLYVKIKNLTNKTTSEFVRDIRLEEAARLLKEGWLNVSEVAFKVGFRDPKYLSKKFKSKFGICPSDYRKGG